MALNGIDISNHQHGLDLNKVPCDFVILKATQGTTFVDKYCDGFYQTAKNAGKCLGVYHYASGKDPKVEADFFLKNVANYVGEAILVLDWEAGSNASWGKNDKEWIKTWCDHVHEKTGVKPMVYIQQSAMSKAQGIGDYGLWIAQYASNKTTGYQATPWNEGKYACAIRQYSSAGRLSGWNGNLDLDKFYGDRDAWKAYATGSVTEDTKKDPTPAPTPTPTPAHKAPEGTTLDLAYGVMTNKYGAGDARKAALGTRYQEVQNFIDHIYSASVDTLVAEVKADKYGTGEVRKVVLGSRYNEVQKKINADSKKSNAQIAQEVLEGKWGNGVDRKKRLTAAGYNYDAIQAIINSKSKPASTGKVYYTIKRGDTLGRIASRYGTTVSRICSLNGIKNPNNILAGRTIRIK